MGSKAAFGAWFSLPRFPRPLLILVVAHTRALSPQPLSALVVTLVSALVPDALHCPRFFLGPGRFG